MKKIVRPATELAKLIASDISVLISTTLESKSEFNLVLTGGTLGIQTVAELGRQSVDWSRVNIWFGDERFVALDDPDRNEAQAIAAWPKLASCNLYRYPDSKISLQTARERLESQLEADFGPVNGNEPVFDLVLLGMGPDGHVASLFPGREHGTSWIIAEDDSPKPPSARLSMGYEALNRSNYVWFIVSGAAKADALRSALNENDLPASKVTGRIDTVWYLDQEINDAL